MATAGSKTEHLRTEVSSAPRLHFRRELPFKVEKSKFVTSIYRSPLLLIQIMLVPIFIMQFSVTYVGC
jgi:hypothetical protein